MRRHLCRLAFVLAMAAMTSRMTAQALSRIAASPSVVMSNAVFFHNRTIAILTMPALVEGIWRVPVTPPKALVIAWRTDPPASTGSVEVRGTLYDVGRFAPDDSRLQAFGAIALVKLLNRDRWPARDTFLLLSGASWTIAPPSSDISLRAVVLDPERFDGQKVIVRGRFRGQNLFGDVPSWPRQTQWDFVLQAGDAALWITGMRPKGSDFDLDPKSRRDTTHFLEVTGVVKIVQGLPTVAATAMKTMPPLDEAPEPVIEAPAAPIPAPEVVFSAPANGEADIPRTSTVRIQFSRDMVESSFTDRIHVRYPPNATAAPPAFTVTYRANTQAIELRFAAPLAPLTVVTVDLAEGITSKDDRPLAPTSISFTTDAGDSGSTTSARFRLGR